MLRCLERLWGLEDALLGFAPTSVESQVPTRTGGVDYSRKEAQGQGADGMVLPLLLSNSWLHSSYVEQSRVEGRLSASV